MKDAFERIGYEVAVVMGDAMDRKMQIRSIKQRIQDGECFDFLYSESSTMPTMLTEDHHLPINPLLDFSFFRFCRKNHIAIGLFYRDIHWRFAHYGLSRTNPKAIISNFFYKLDLLLYQRYLDVLYLPSVEMGKHVPELSSLRTVPLPPGNDFNSGSIEMKTKVSRPIHFLYVGGLGELYNLKMFLDVITGYPLGMFKLTICTRKDDYDRVRHHYIPYTAAANVQVTHVRGRELSLLYQECDICCLYLKPTAYWDFAMPVKLFEYISFFKPILAVKGTAAGNFIEGNKLGWSIAFDKDVLEDCLDNLEVELQDGYPALIERLGKVASKSTWVARAKSVVKTLSGIK